MSSGVGHIIVSTYEDITVVRACKRERVYG